MAISFKTIRRLYLKETKALIRKDTYTPMFIAALFTIAKIWKCPSIDWWIKNNWYICNGILLSHKNEILLFVTTWKDPEGITLSEMSDKDKYHMVSLNCGIQKTNEQA